MQSNPTPKELFHKSSQSVSAHKRMVQSDEFELGINTAMLQFVRALSERKVNDVGTAAAYHFYIVGAAEFVTVLRSLADQSAAPAIIDFDNLPANTRK